MTLPPLTVTCRAGTHRVRLEPERYWRDARCPVCRTPLDPWRRQRLRAWLNGEAPRSRLVFGARRVAPAQALGGLTLAAALFLALLYRVAGDVGLVGTVLLYIGRWIWLVPVGAVAAICALAGPRRLLLPGAAACVVLLGVMDFHLGWRRLLPVPDGRPLRVLTYNIEGGRTVLPRLAELVADERPDVIALQECGAEAQAALAELQGFTVDVTQGCFASRFPIDSVRAMPIERYERIGGLVVASYILRTPGGRVVVTNLHLETPRKGLERLLDERIATARTAIADNTLLREIESKQARAWVDAPGLPRIVLGDFNLPSDSRIFRRHWGDLTDAWRARGVGFGHTKRNGWIAVRIDHVLVDARFRVGAVHVGQDYGSDHLPLIAEVHWR